MDWTQEQNVEIWPLYIIAMKIDRVILKLKAIFGEHANLHSETVDQHVLTEPCNT